MRFAALLSLLFSLGLSAQCYTVKRTVIDYSPCGQHIVGGTPVGDAVGLMRGDTLRMRLPNNTRWLTLRVSEYVADTSCHGWKNKLSVDGYKCDK